MLKRKTVLLTMVLLVMTMGCVTTQPQEDMTPLRISKLAYLDSIQWYHSQAKTYITWFKAASPATQEKWRNEISPLFLEAKDALDIWKMFNDEGIIPDEATLEAFKDLKTRILMGLAKEE